MRVSKGLDGQGGTSFPHGTFEHETSHEPGTRIWTQAVPVCPILPHWFWPAARGWDEDVDPAAAVPATVLRPGYCLWRTCPVSSPGMLVATSIARRGFGLPYSKAMKLWGCDAHDAPDVPAHRRGWSFCRHHSPRSIADATLMNDPQRRAQLGRGRQLARGVHLGACASPRAGVPRRSRMIPQLADYLRLPSYDHSRSSSDERPWEGR